MEDFILMAQVVPDPYAVAEWIKTGLLGGVLGWLMFVHLPSKDKQIKEMNEASAVERGGLREEARKDREVMFAQFNSGLNQVLVASRDMTERLSSEWKDDATSLKSSIDELTDAIRVSKHV